MTLPIPWQGTLSPGERATNDLRYGFAEVCLQIQSPIPFYSPRVVGSGELIGFDSEGNPRAYLVGVSGAYGLPDAPASAANEALVTMYLPEGTDTLQPAIVTIDPGGGESYTQLGTLEVSVVAGERLCVEDCIRVFIEPPMITLTWDCGGTLQCASEVTGPWSDLAGESSPFTTTAGNSQNYYRIRIP